MTMRDVTEVSDRAAAIDNAKAHLDATAMRLADAQRVRDAATAAREVFGFDPIGTISAKVRLKILLAEEACEEAEAALAACVRVHTGAHVQWSTLERAARRARQIACTRQALADAQALTARLDADLADRVATAGVLGVVDGGAHPRAVAQQLVHTLEFTLRELEPPPPAPVPVPPGKTCIRVLERFQDGQRNWHHATYAGQALGPIDLDAPDAAEAIEKGWAVEVPEV